MEPRNGRHAASLIALCDLVKVYRTPAGDFPALRSIDLEVGSGEFVAVVGKSGSGKTTMINMLTGIDRSCSVGSLPNCDPIKIGTRSHPYASRI